MITMTGAEFKRFLADPDIWANDATYYDDARILVDRTHDENRDLEHVSDGAVIEVDGGYIYGALAGVLDDLEDCMSDWLAKQTTTQFVIAVPKGKVQAFLAALDALGMTPAPSHWTREPGRAVPNST